MSMHTVYSVTALRSLALSPPAPQGALLIYPCRVGTAAQQAQPDKAVSWM